MKRLLFILKLSLMVAPILLGSLNLKAEEEELKPVTLILKYYKVREDSSFVKVMARTREGKKIVYIPNIIVNLYLNNNSREGMQGSISTDENGEGTFILPSKFYRVKDTSVTFTLIASTANNPGYEDSDAELELSDGILKVELIDDDTIRYVKAFFGRKDSGRISPVADADVKFYVKRMFSLLPFGGRYTFTDDEGEVKVAVPDDLPGDESGNLTFIVKVEDNDEVGNLMAMKEASWGVPLVVEDNEKRALWSSAGNAPIWLVITVNLLILLTWGMLIYLIIQLFRIKKLGKT